ncbi:hypothetical protein DFP73DRAFT_535869 [Morchella snyderi]|nr:hypothetical protein DFP73DRAFT_535869 [Morchella snyderi]
MIYLYPQSLTQRFVMYHNLRMLGKCPLDAWTLSGSLNDLPSQYNLECGEVVVLLPAPEQWSETSSAENFAPVLTRMPLSSFRRRNISSPSSPKAAEGISSSARFAAASKALYTRVVGRDIREYLGPGAAKTGSDNSKGKQALSAPVDSAVIDNNREDTRQATVTSRQPNDRLSPWEEAILGVPEIKTEFTANTTGDEGHKDFIDGLITEIKNYNTDINNRRWFRINDEGEKVFFVEKVIFQLEKYAKIGDVAIQHNPDVVALVWAGFRFLLQVGSAYTKDMQTVTEGIELIVCSICECHFFERLYLGVGLELGDELRKSIVKFYASILRFLVYGKSYLSKSTANRVQESFSSELTPLTENMRKLLVDVKSKVGVVHMQWEERRHDGLSEEMSHIRQAISALERPLGNTELRNTVEKLYDHVQVNRRLDILKWLSDVPFREHHTFNSQRRQEDTGQWLLRNESFLQWRDLEESSIFWMRGNAGSGKTLLASFIIDEFQAAAGTSNEHMMAYFYCDYKEPARSDRESILRAIVKQFCLKGPASDHIPSLVTEMYSIREKDGFASGKLRVSESTKLIVGLAGKYRDVTIVMDGIDECDRGTRAELFCAINEISKADSKVKIILTGRYDNDIENMFSTAHKHYLTAKDNTEDITKYVETQMGERCDPTRQSTMQLILNGAVPPDLKQEIIDTLCEKSNGMFMWVHLQILALCEENTAGGIRQALKELPKDLNATYDQILKRITEKGPRFEKVANLVLRWLIYAQAVCSTETVIQAIAIQPGSSKLDDDLLQWEIRHILGACQNLVVHDSVLGNFQFAHFSVKEYLQRHPRFEDVETSQTRIAEVCLTAHVYHSTDSKRGAKVGELLGYSSKHWPAHIRLSGDAGFQALRPLWTDFLESAEAYRFWMDRAPSNGDLLGPGGSGHVSPLWATCYHGLLPMARYLLQRGDDPNTINGDEETPLFHAAELGNGPVARMLVEHEGVDINKVGSGGRSPLLAAADSGSTEVAEILLGRKDLRVNPVDGNGVSALGWAVFTDSLGIVRLLVKRKDVLVNGEGGQPRYSPLWLAVQNRKVQALQLLLEREDLAMTRDPDPNSEYGNHTPLTWAQSKGRSEIALLLSRRFGSESEPGVPRSETKDHDTTGPEPVVLL